METQEQNDKQLTREIIEQKVAEFAAYINSQGDYVDEFTNRHGVQVQIHTKFNRVEIRVSWEDASFDISHPTGTGFDFSKVLPNLNEVTPQIVKDNWEMDYVLYFQKWNHFLGRVQPKWELRPHVDVRWRNADEIGHYYPDWHYNRECLSYQFLDEGKPMEILGRDKADYMYTVNPYECGEFIRLFTSRKYKQLYQDFLKVTDYKKARKDWWDKWNKE